MDRLAEIRARKALQEAGLPHTGELRRADSTRNEVFLTEHHVVRTNQQAGSRLAREAVLCATMAGFPWAPKVVGQGDRPGSDYLIVERKPGLSLSRCWPELSQAQRRAAIDQLGRNLAQLHRLPVDRRAVLNEQPPHLIGGPSPVAHLLTGVDRLERVAGVDLGLVAEIRDRVIACEGALHDYRETHLIHGDLTFENILWDGTTITGLIDLEWCRGGPADLDLDVLGRFLSIPEVHVPPEARRKQRADAYTDVPLWLAEAHPELFAADRLAERLMLYALAFEVNGVLAGPPPAADRNRDELSAYGRLGRLMATGGHVGELIGRLGFVSI